MTTTKRSRMRRALAHQCRECRRHWALHSIHHAQRQMTFWTDAAVLGAAGIPSVLFGPGGAGLHSVEEYVNLNDVLVCRDALVRLGEMWSAEG